MAITDEQIAEFTAEQMAQIDQDIREYRIAEEARINVMNPEHQKARKMDAIRIAQTIVLENRRLLPAGEAAAVTAQDLIQIAEDIMAFAEPEDAI